jgi:iron complex outermembrane recepter protein
MKQCYLSAILAAGLVATHLCFAQEANESMTTEDVVVTATRFLDRYQDKPVSVTVISAKELSQSTARTVPELLSLQAGLGGSDLYGNNGARASVDLRGFGATAAQNTLILLDGRRLNDIDISGVQWSAVPLDSLERIEIVRNGGSVLYGDGAVAGVINLITRKPGVNGNEGAISRSAGNFGVRAGRVEGEIAGADVGLRGGGSYFESDGFRKNNRNIESGVYAEIRGDWDNDALAVRLSGAHQNLRLPGGRFVQPSIAQNELESDRRGTSTPKDYAARDDAILHMDYSHNTGPVSGILGVSYRRKVQTSYFDRSGFPDYREVDLDVLSLTPRLRVDHSNSTLPGVLVVGIDWYSWDYQLSLASSPAGIGQPVHRVKAGQNNRAAYLMETFSIGSSTTATAGLRRERFKIQAKDAFDPTAPNPSFFGGGASEGTQKEKQKAMELGLRHAFSSDLSGFARVAKAFRFATVDEVYESSTTFDQEFQFLRPQTSKTYEFGADWRSSTTDLQFGIFRTDLRNEIHLDPFTSGIGNTNLPPSRRQGFEFELKKKPSNSADLRFAYTYTDAKFLKGTFPGGPFTPTNVGIAGNAVPLVPRHRAILSANISLPQQFRLGLVTSYVSDQFMENDEENSLGIKIPAYALTDMDIAYDANKWTMGLKVSNLFDREYYNYAVRSQFTPDRYSAYPLPGRSVLFTVKVDFSN